MAIAIDASSPAIVSNSNTTKVTASFTAPADSIIVACTGHSNSATITMSSSGTALTWTSRKTLSAAGQVDIFTAIAPTAVARTVTATSSVGSNSGALKVFVVTGGDTSSPVGATGSGTSSSNAITPNAYTSTAAGSRGIGIANDWAALGSPTSTDTGFSYNVTGSTSGIAVYKAANTATAGTVVTMNFDGSGTAAADWAWAAIEIKPGSTPQTVTTSAIASGEAFGTGQLNFLIAPTPIASGEAFGDLFISTPQAQTITPSGIASDQALGTLTTGLFISPTSIASGEAFGAGRLFSVIGPVGIASGEAFGATNVAIQQFITPIGLLSDEVFGTTRLQIGYPQTVRFRGITSQRRVSEPVVKLLHRRMLQNPSIQEAPAALSRPFNRFGIHRGISIIKRVDGSYYSARYPAQTELEEAEAFYLGGRFHAISNEIADELIIAGYGAYIVLLEND